MVKRIKKRIRAKRVKLNFNTKRIKKLIKDELFSYYTKNDKDENNKIINNKEDEETEYNNRYSKYMLEDFNVTLVNMLITYINKNKTLPNDFKKEPNFMNKFVNLIKHLLMNEVELVAFTILIDKIGWKHKKIDCWIYLTILGIYSKKLVGREEESSFLINIFSIKNNQFFENYTNICDEEIVNKFDEKKYLTIKSINQRFKKLNKPINSYCRKNNILYNGVVDEIVKWSQPYGQENNGNQLNNDKQLDLNINNDILINIKGDYKEEEFLYPFPAEQNNNSIHLIPNNSFNNNANNSLFQINNYNFRDLNKESGNLFSLNLNNIPSSQYFKLENNISNNSINKFI